MLASQLLAFFLPITDLTPFDLSGWISPYFPLSASHPQPIPESRCWMPELSYSILCKIDLPYLSLCLSLSLSLSRFYQFYNFALTKDFPPIPLKPFKFTTMCLREIQFLPPAYRVEEQRGPFAWRLEEMVCWVWDEDENFPDCFTDVVIELVLQCDVNEALTGAALEERKHPNKLRKKCQCSINEVLIMS